MAGKVDIIQTLSKKIAELTVVVHMLFKRNHEKEVEYEFFKLVNEEDKKKSKEQCTVKIAWLEQQLAEQETYRSKIEYQLSDLANLQGKIGTLEELVKELKGQVEINEQDLILANLEITDLKDKNESLVRELANKSERQEPLKEDNDELVRSLEDKLAELKLNHKDEITKLYGDKVLLQRKLENYNSSLSQELDDLKESLHILTSKQIEDQKKMDEMKLERDEIEEALRRSNEDKKNLQKKLQIVNEQMHLLLKNNNNKNKKYPEEQERPKKPLFQTRDEELERLKQEVQLYKRELQNREGNFNRMFADQQPVIVQNQPDPSLVERNLTGTRISKRQHLPKLGNERSLTFAGGIKRTTFR
eukprot:gene9833-10842_t